MTDKFDTSRRDFVAADVTVAAAAGAASGAQAQTQPPSNLRFSNPPSMSKPPSYSHVVEVNGPHRTVYLAGQTGVDANGKVAEGIRAQTMQVLENVKTALAFAGGGPRLSAPPLLSYARAREAVPIFRMTFPSQTAGEYVERR